MAQLIREWHSADLQGERFRGTLFQAIRILQYETYEPQVGLPRYDHEDFGLVVQVPRKPIDTRPKRMDGLPDHRFRNLGGLRRQKYDADEFINILSLANLELKKYGILPSLCHTFAGEILTENKTRHAVFLTEIPAMPVLFDGDRQVLEEAIGSISTIVEEAMDS